MKITLQNKNLKELVEYIKSLKTDEDILFFLREILSDKELFEIPKRLQIIKLLKQGNLSQHQIAKTLNVGIATVTRGSKELQKGSFANYTPWSSKD